MQLILSLSLIFSLLTTSILATPLIVVNPNLTPSSSSEKSLLITRQTQTGNGAASGSAQTRLSPNCLLYSTLANYTFIDNNSTLRAAYLLASPKGTDPTRVVLDNANKEFVKRNMMFDVALNRECGNLSTVAAAEVGRNFSRGIIGEFKVDPNIPGARIGAGREVWVVAVGVMMMCAMGYSL